MSSEGLYLLCSWLRAELGEAYVDSNRILVRTGRADPLVGTVRLANGEVVGAVWTAGGRGASAGLLSTQEQSWLFCSYKIILSEVQKRKGEEGPRSQTAPQQLFTSTLVSNAANSSNKSRAHCSVCKVLRTDTNPRFSQGEEALIESTNSLAPYFRLDLLLFLPFNLTPQSLPQLRPPRDSPSHPPSCSTREP